MQRVTFTYTGYDIDAVLDRLPTAKILSEENGTYQIEAEVMDRGRDVAGQSGKIRQRGSDKRNITSELS